MRIKLGSKPNKARYIMQRDKRNCGPIAILNALKWCGYNATFKYLRDLKKYCKTDKNGTESKNVTSALNRYKKIEVKHTKNLTIGMLDEHLDNGYCAVILMSRWYKGPERHYFVITEKRNKFGQRFYTTVNWGLEDKIVVLSRRKVVNIFRRSLKAKQDPKTWFVKRKDNES